MLSYGNIALAFFSMMENEGMFENFIDDLEKYNSIIISIKLFGSTVLFQLKF